MKKLLIMMAVLSLFAFAACSDSAVETPNDIKQSSDDTSDATLDEYEILDSAEESIACYYSLLTEDGFDNYLLAFPEAFRYGYQHIDLEYDDETFDNAVADATQSLHSLRDQKYDYTEYHIEYELRGEEEVTGSDRDLLIRDLALYCHMNAGTIEKVVNHTYYVYEYGYDATTQELVGEENREDVITMLYITNEGWFVSPNEFQLP